MRTTCTFDAAFGLRWNISKNVSFSTSPWGKTDLQKHVPELGKPSPHLKTLGVQVDFTRQACMNGQRHGRRKAFLVARRTVERITRATGSLYKRGKLIRTLALPKIIFGGQWAEMRKDCRKFLERMSVAPASFVQYREVYQSFLRQCRRSHLPIRTPAQLDRAVLAVLHEMFREGGLSNEFQKMVSVMKKFRPVVVAVVVKLIWGILLVGRAEVERTSVAFR